MATTNFVYPYRAASRSAIALSQAIGGKVISLKNSKFRPARHKLVVNWGSTSMPEEILQTCKVLNDPNKLRTASNKYLFFKTCSEAEDGPRVPTWTIEKKVAEEWFDENPNLMVFARTELAGHSGEGIVKVKNKQELAAIREGTLLVQYVKKKREFRAHVSSKSGVFVVQEKKRKIEVPLEAVDFEVRNLANGFIFAKNEIVIPNGLEEQAVKALAATGLDFGAVDIIYNERQEHFYVLELNSAPGLEGSTLDAYRDEIKKFER